MSPKPSPVVSLHPWPCVATDSSNIVVTFVGDITVVGLVTNGNDQEEISCWRELSHRFMGNGQHRGNVDAALKNRSLKSSYLTRKESTVVSNST